MSIGKLRVLSACVAVFTVMRSPARATEQVEGEEARVCGYSDLCSSRCGGARVKVMIAEVDVEASDAWPAVVQSSLFAAFAELLAADAQDARCETRYNAKEALWHIYEVLCGNRLFPAVGGSDIRCAAWRSAVERGATVIFAGEEWQRLKKESVFNTYEIRIRETSHIPCPVDEDRF